MSHELNDDLFEGTKMTFGEHLEELRASLFKAIIGLVIGFVIGCFIANRVVGWIQTPVLNALEVYSQDHARARLEKEYGSPLPPEIDRMVESGYMPEDSMMIEPFGLLDRLQRDYPDQFPFDFTPYKFIPGDIATEESLLGSAEDQTIPLAKQLIRDGQLDKDSPGKEVWVRLSSAQQQRLQSIADAETASDAEKVELVSLLNSVLESEDLHRSTAFDDINQFRKSEEANGWFESWFESLNGDRKSPTELGVIELRQKREENPDEFDSEDSHRLNRLLLATYLGDYIRPPRVNVVEVPTWKPIRQRLQSLKAEEAFMIWLKAALVAGAVLSSPWIFLQIWNFVAAGLYPHEKKYVYLYLPVSLILFLSGAVLAFYFVFPPVLKFLFTFNQAMNIDPDPRIGEWLGFVLFLPIGFGISFQLPLVMLFVNRIGVVTIETYLEKWRIAVLVIFVIAMILTPADPVSMLLMAVPLTILYFGGIAMCKWMPRGRNPFDEGYEPT